MTDDNEPTRDELEQRVEQLEATVEEMLPNRRQTLKGLGILGAGGLLGAAGGSASASTGSAGQIGTDADRPTIKADDVDANLVSTDELLGNEAGLNLAEVIWPIRTQGGLFTTFFESVDGWEQETSGSGSISLGTEGVSLSTGATSGSHARLSKKPNTTGEFKSYGFTGWEQDRVFAAHVHFQDTQGPIHAVFGGVGEGRYVDEHFGFAMVGGDLVGTVADGSTNNRVTLISGASTGTYRLRAEFNSDNEVVFYVDDSQEGSTSTNIPAGGDNFNNWLNTYLVENSTTTDRALEVSTGRAGERP